MAVQVIAHKSKGTGFFTTLASTLTKITGLKNIKLNMGENKHIEIADLDSTYEAPFDVDLTGAQGLTADVIYDPLGATHQDLAKQKNERTGRAGKLVLGATGQELPVAAFTVKKFDVDAEVGNALMGSIEVAFNELVELPEVDPS
jgi:hypothetical protein